MNAINHTEAQAIHATASAAPAVLLEAADPSKNLILVPLSRLVSRPTGRNVRKTPRHAAPAGCRTSAGRGAGYGGMVATHRRRLFPACAEGRDSGSRGRVRTGARHPAGEVEKRRHCQRGRTAGRWHWLDACYLQRCGLFSANNSARLSKESASAEKANNNLYRLSLCEERLLIFKW